MSKLKFRDNDNNFIEVAQKSDLDTKADIATTYTKTETDTLLNAKADINDIPTKTSDLTNDSGFITSSYHDTTKQDTLVSGTNIKTINNQSLLGSGNIEIQGGSGNVDDVKVNGTSVVDSDKIAQVTVPTKTSDITNDSGFITSSYHDNTKQDVISDLSDIRSNASAGKSASDTISTYGNIVTHSTSEFATASQGSKADTAVQPSDLGSLASKDTVDYNTDIINKPTIPTVNDGTLTIQKNGTTIDTFTANSSANKTINVTVPTDNNELTNGAGYQTSTNVDTKISLHDSSNSAHSTLLSGKQDTISDLSDIRSGASAGATALQASDVINNVTSTATNKPLSANMGKELQDQITNLKSRGRYLSIWNCTTGLAETTPTVDPYEYRAGDYFIVGVVGTTNYRPTGSTYSASIPSTTVETGDVKVNDTYYYDGTSWTLLDIGQVSTTFSSLGGSPYDNSNLASALNSKIEDVKVNGTSVVTNKVANVTVPTKTSDLTNDSNYVTNTDYASTSIAGVIKVGSTSATTTSSGLITAMTRTYEQYQDGGNSTFIGKGTLENVITGKELVNQTQLDTKQNIQSNDLQTSNKNIVSAINEVNSIAKGANQAVGYSNYQTLITAFNALASDKYKVGQNIYVVTREVPDLWVSSIEETSSTYTYVNDATVVSDLETNGYIQVGYYKLSMLETQKVDLTNYVKNTDYVTGTTAGVWIAKEIYGLRPHPNNDGSVYILKATNQEIDAKSNNYKPIVPANLDYAVRSVRPEVKTALDTPLQVNTIYDLDDVASLTLQLPQGQVGDFIQVQFLCKTTATSLSITSDYGMTVLDLTPEVGNTYSIYGEWGKVDTNTYGWKLASFEAPIPTL